MTLGDPAIHPAEIWMWGRQEAIGTSLHWLIHHRVLRNKEWVDAIPYSATPEECARSAAAEMAVQTSSVDHRLLYRDVTVTGPHVSWREIAWKYRDGYEVQK